MIIKLLLRNRKFKYFIIASFLVLLILYKSMHFRIRIKYMIPKHLNKFLFQESYSPYTTTNLEEISDKVHSLNDQFIVANWQKFGPVCADTVVVAVPLRRDAERLRHLLASLAQVRDIHTVLLIFSHIHIDADINHLIELIDFCMVLQLFHPNSLQRYHNNVSDCENCRNGSEQEELYYGVHEARSAEAKLLWWWTATTVFERLGWATRHKQMVVFIEEDSYVLSDFLHMLRFSRRALAYVPDADVLSFGRPLAIDLDYNKLTVDTWGPPYDKGLAFNITTWRKISMLAKHYCEYDDTSWSYSLMHLFERFAAGRAVAVASMAPRVLSTGVFRSGKEALHNIWSITTGDELFPEKIKVVVLFGRNGKVFRDRKRPPNGNGGWQHIRNQLLCLDPFMFITTAEDSTTTPPIFTAEANTNIP